MNIVFQAYVYKPEVYKLLQTVPDLEIDQERDCIIKPLALDPECIILARPDDEFKDATVIELITGSTYCLKIKFDDYLRIVPHQSARELKSRFCN